MNRLVTKIAEIESGEIISYSGNYDFYERERNIRAGQSAGRFFPPAVHAGKRAAVY